MQKISFYLFAVILFATTISGCRKDIYGCTDPTAANYARAANVDNGSCLYYGNLMFWTNQDEGVVTVTINNQTQNITQFQTGGTPNCGNQGTANFTLEEGTYGYTASSPGSATINAFSESGNITVIAGTCNTVRL